MPHSSALSCSSALRVLRSLLASLAIASSLSALSQAAEPSGSHQNRKGTWVPVVGLATAVAHSPQRTEPKPLIVAAQSIRLKPTKQTPAPALAAAKPKAQPAVKVSQAKPTVQFAAPFDPKPSTPITAQPTRHIEYKRIQKLAARIQLVEKPNLVAKKPASQPLVVRPQTETTNELTLPLPTSNVTTVLRKRSSSPVVKLVASPIDLKPIAVIEPLPQLALEPQSVLLRTIEPEAEPAAAEPSVPKADVARTHSPTVAATPVLPFIMPEPILATLQQSPEPSDLPTPQEEAAVTKQKLVEAEEIEALELGLKPIGALSTRTAPQAGELPTNYAAARFAREGEQAQHMGFSRATLATEFNWEAPAICHRPLYFEDINLERHGYKIPLIQPAISAAHFFGRVPLLPYMMVAEGHRDCQYTLGHYRPGDYAPYSLYVPRLRLDATTAEAAVAAALIFAIP